MHFENATHSELTGCLLDAPGGNGVFLSGFSDGIEVHSNEIRFAGDSLVAAAGKASKSHMISSRPFKNGAKNRDLSRVLHPSLPHGCWVQNTSRIPE